MTREWLRSIAVLLMTGVVALAQSTQPAGRLGTSPTTQPAQTQPAREVASAIEPEAALYLELSGLEEQLAMLDQLARRAGYESGSVLLQQLLRGQVGTATMPGMATLLTPAMLAEFGRIGGVAMGFREFPAQGKPGAWAASLQFGRSLSMRNFVMFVLASGAPTMESRDGWVQYSLSSEVEAALLDDALILASPRGSVGEAVARWRGASKSLADVPAFRAEASKRRQGGGLMVYIPWAPLDRAIANAQSPEERPGYELGRRVLGLDSYEDLWATAKLTPRGARAEVALRLKGDECAAYRLVRTAALDRALLRYIPADALACAAMTLTEGAGRYQALVDVLTLAGQADNPQESRENVEDKLAGLADTHGIAPQKLMEAIEGVAVAMLPPDVAKLSLDDMNRRKAQNPATQPVAEVPTRREMFESSLIVVVQVADGAAFDRLLEGVARQWAGAGDATVTVDRREAFGTERRTYRVNNEPQFEAGVRDRAYVLAKRAVLVDAGMAAFEGRIPDATQGRLSGPMLNQAPADASKVALLRVDLLANTVVAMRTLALTQRPGSQLWAPVPNLKPLVAYTRETPDRVEVVAEFEDAGALLQCLLQMVPRPPRPEQVRGRGLGAASRPVR